MSYQAVIGLEIHNELKTESKIFCSCKNKFSDEPNINCCPICVGMPGTLPVLNKGALELAIKAGLALGCKINNMARWDRKNYYYPDLAKAYQISELDEPICLGGHIDIKTDKGPKRIRFNRIHLEEDAGKLVHTAGGTLVDYNRAGVPLIEMVTEPDMSSAEEAVAVLEAVKSVLKYLGVSDCKMEEGSLRCDVNISLHKPGEPFGTRTEMKNLASFKAVHRAITYEIKRQQEILESGGKIVQETRRWDDSKGKSYSMRTKEDAQDYRYFSDPDLVRVIVTEQDIERIKSTLPMLAGERAKKYCEEYNLPEYDSEVLTSDKVVADFFDACVQNFNNPKMISNWIMTEVMRKLKESESEDIIIPLNPKNFTDMLKVYESGKINQNAAKTLFEYLWVKDANADIETLIKTLNLGQISDEGELEKIVAKIIADNPKPVADLKSGNTKTMAFFVGQVMKATQGKANPAIVTSLVNKLINQ